MSWSTIGADGAPSRPLLGGVDTVAGDASNVRQAIIEIIHAGPAAIVILAAAKLHTLARSLVVYERIGAAREGPRRFVPALRWPAGEIQIGSGAGAAAT